MANIYQGPIATRLVPLSSLYTLPIGEKVRFLGCVIKYDISSATLTLEHKFPIGSNYKALIDINLLLGNLDSTDTRIGEWVNVMGYIAVPPSKQDRKIGAKNVMVCVQAIVLWSAGTIKLDEYETSLIDRLDSK